MPEQAPTFIETPLTNETDIALHESSPDLLYTYEEVKKARLAAAGLFETVKTPEVLTVPMEILFRGARTSEMRHDAANGIPAPEKALESWERFGLAA
jgi:hypothetical protein